MCRSQCNLRMTRVVHAKRAEANLPIAIIGSGSYARALSSRLINVNGVSVCFGSRNPPSDEESSQPRFINGFPVLSVKEAIEKSTLVILAVPSSAHERVALDIAVVPLAKKLTIIDISNPPSAPVLEPLDKDLGRNTCAHAAFCKIGGLSAPVCLFSTGAPKDGPDMEDMPIKSVQAGETDEASLSIAESLQRYLPNHMIVKAFNTVSAYALSMPKGCIHSPPVVVCSDHQEGKIMTERLVSLVGLRYVDGGSLKGAHSLEASSHSLFPAWRIPIIISFLVFCCCFTYIAIRDVVVPCAYGGKCHPGNLLFLKMHIILAWASATLVTIVYGGYVLASAVQLVTGTSKYPFAQPLSILLAGRKQLGIIALFFGAMHAVLAVGTVPLFATLEYFESYAGAAYQGVLLTGVIVMALFMILAVTSLPSVGGGLSWREFSFVQSRMGLGLVIVLTCHTTLAILSKGHVHFLGGSHHLYLPGVGQLSTLALVTLLACRVCLAIPPFSSYLSSIRSGKDMRIGCFGRCLLLSNE